jgi:hypothetical protein
MLELGHSVMLSNAVCACWSRARDCKLCSIMLLCRTRPIIEGCRQVQTGPVVNHAPVTLGRACVAHGPAMRVPLQWVLYPATSAF